MLGPHPRLSLLPGNPPARSGTSPPPADSHSFAGPALVRPRNRTRSPHATQRNRHGLVLSSSPGRPRRTPPEARHAGHHSFTPPSIAPFDARASHAASSKNNSIASSRPRGSLPRLRDARRVVGGARCLPTDIAVVTAATDCPLSRLCRHTHRPHRPEPPHTTNNTHPRATPRLRPPRPLTSSVSLRARRRRPYQRVPRPSYPVSSNRSAGPTCIAPTRGRTRGAGEREERSRGGVERWPRWTAEPGETKDEERERGTGKGSA